MIFLLGVLDSNLEYHYPGCNVFLDFLPTTGRQLVCYILSDVILSVSHVLHDHPIIHKALYKPRKEYYLIEVT